MTNCDYEKIDKFIGLLINEQFVTDNDIIIF